MQFLPYWKVEINQTQEYLYKKYFESISSIFLFFLDLQILTTEWETT